MTFTKINDIVKKWNEIFDLEEMFDDGTPISLCLETQLLKNETDNAPAMFKRTSIPLLIRLFKESKAYKRNTFVNYFEDCKPQITILKTKFDLSESKDLDEEAERTAVAAFSLAKDIDELFGDLMNEEIIFHGLGCLADGTITLTYSKP